MAQISNSSYCVVYKVQYTYDDVELSKCVSLVELCPTFHSVVEYLHSIENEMSALDNAFYRCRSNIRIKVSPDLISNKKYVQLFKNE